MKKNSNVKITKEEYNELRRFVVGTDRLGSDADNLLQHYLIGLVSGCATSSISKFLISGEVNKLEQDCKNHKMRNRLRKKLEERKKNKVV